MSTNLRQEDQERSGTKDSSARRSEPRAKERPTFRSFFRELLHYDYKNAGVAIFGGHPETARSNLSRILESKHHRHADWEWIDLILEAAGGDSPEGRGKAEAEFITFVCTRFGFEVPARLPSEEKDREELANIKGKLGELLESIPGLVQSIDRLEKRSETKR